MALASRKYEDLFDKTGSGRKRMTDEKQTRISASFASGVINEEPTTPDALEALIYQTKLIQEDLDEIRRYLGAEVVSNTATNLSVTAGGTSLTINSSDGTNASIPAATTNAWGAMTDENFDAIAANTAKTGITTDQANAITANTAKFSAPGVYDDRGTDKVFLPASSFVGKDYTSLTAEDGTTTSNRAGTLIAMWPGISGKTVDGIYVHTNSARAISGCVNAYRTQLGTTTSLLARAGNSDTLLNITDWTCALGESLAITIAPGATTTKVHGVTLIFG